ncbi:MAG: hypothetical protein HQL97_04535 [Magnetococcales bacterium]|nr:hypothetical protein [Magnetococcales bacterium]
MGFLSFIGAIVGAVLLGPYLAGATIIGITITAAAATAIGAITGSMIGGMLEPKPKLGDFGQGQAGILLNQRSTTAPVPVVYGTRYVGGPTVFWETTGSTREYLQMVVVLSEGPISAINTVYLDDVPITDAKFNGLVECYRHLGDETTADAVLVSRSASWTTNHTLRGFAYLYLQLTYNSSAFTGMPTVTADVDGRTLYDPRTGTTHFSSNPALAIRDYLTNTLYGRGLPINALDDDSFIEAANYCDATVVDPDATRPRYTCNGAINTANPLMDNLKDLLTCCAGRLVWSAGRYRLIIDRDTPVSFDFTPDNIVGSWVIDSGDQSVRANRIECTWYNPDTAWQPDILTIDSPAFRTEDKGFLLEKKVELPFTSNSAMAARLGWILLKTSRLGLGVEFTANMSAQGVKVGSVVSISHPTPGWTAKQFIVVKVQRHENDEVKVTARAFDPDTYVASITDTYTPPRGVNLPDPYRVMPPSGMDVTEDLYTTRPGAGGIKSKAIITWTRTDVTAEMYRVFAKPAESAEWRSIGIVSDTAFEWLDVAPGLYDFRVVAVNGMGVSSSPTETTREIHGLSVPPANMTGLTLSGLGGMALLRWDVSPDLDVRIGGGVLIRHTPDTTGATWSASTSASNRLPGDATSATLPLRTGTYMLRFIDSSGILSPGYAAIVATQATVLAYGGTGTISFHPDWVGDKTGCAVDDDALKLDGTVPVDAWGEIDAIALVDLAGGGIATDGMYTPSEILDFGSLVRRRLTAIVRATIYSANDMIDARQDPIDIWIDIDAEGVAGADAHVEASYTQDDPNITPSWSEWHRLEVHEMVARAARFRLHLSSDGFFNISIFEFSIISDGVQS